MMKKCSKCGELKPESEFYKRRSGRINSECKTCSNQMTSDYVKRRCRTDSAFMKRRMDGFLSFKTKQVCDILKKHTEDLADDKERLSTDFIMDIMTRGKKVG